MAGEVEVWSSGDLRVDTGLQEVQRAGVPLVLPPLSFALLVEVLRAAPNVLTLDKGTSKLAQAPAAHSLLVEVERYAGEVPEVTAHQPPVIIDREVLPAAE